MATNPYLKRYNIHFKRGNEFTSSPIEENDNGKWVRYNDVWTLDNNIFAALNDVKILEKRVEELEEEMEWHKEARFQASEANVIIMDKYLKLKEKYEPSNTYGN